MSILWHVTLMKATYPTDIPKFIRWWEVRGDATYWTGLSYHC